MLNRFRKSSAAWVLAAVIWPFSLFHKKPVAVEHYPTPANVVAATSQPAATLPPCPSDPTVAKYEQLGTPNWAQHTSDGKQPGVANPNLDRVAGRAESGAPCVMPSSGAAK